MMNTKNKLSLVKKNVPIAVIAVFCFVLGVILPIYALAGISSTDDDEILTSMITYMWIPPSKLIAPDYPDRQQKMEDFLLALCIPSAQQLILSQIQLELSQRSIHSILKYLSYHEIEGVDDTLYNSKGKHKRHENIDNKNQNQIADNHECKKNRCPTIKEKTLSDNDISSDDYHEQYIWTVMNECYDECGKLGLLNYIVQLLQIGSFKAVEGESDFVPLLSYELTAFTNSINDSEVKSQLASIILKGISLRLASICSKYNINPDFACKKGHPNKIFDFITNTTANLLINSGKIALMTAGCKLLFDRMSVNEDSTHSTDATDWCQCMLNTGSNNIYSDSCTAVALSVTGKDVSLSRRKEIHDIEVENDIYQGFLAVILTTSGVFALGTGHCIRNYRVSNTLLKRINSDNERLAPLMKEY
ncbi:MAG: hypothetical protein QS721_00265 [Candidatus Endonucleobacter sp. (ex Gigantidas childressi)]|nr:hypothetical protein [Candidatus Endonucleobacter sp. (ex Gigantidas childressi)]